MVIYAAYLLPRLSHNINSGLAINMVEYIPDINPTIRQKAKLFNTTPPHINRAAAVNSVVSVV